MDRIRLVLGFKPPQPQPMSDEQVRVDERLNAIARRQQSIGIQVDVGRARDDRRR